MTAAISAGSRSCSRACTRTIALVPQRIAEPLVPGRLAVDHTDAAAGGDRDDTTVTLDAVASRGQLGHDAGDERVELVERARVLVGLVGALRPSRVAEQERLALVGGHGRASRSVVGAVITTTLSNRSSPPVS